MRYLPIVVLALVVAVTVIGCRTPRATDDCVLDRLDRVDESHRACAPDGKKFCGCDVAAACSDCCGPKECRCSPTSRCCGQ